MARPLASALTRDSRYEGSVGDAFAKYGRPFQGIPAEWIRNLTNVQLSDLTKVQKGKWLTSLTTRSAGAEQSPARWKFRAMASPPV